MIRTLIRGFFAGAIVSVVYKYFGVYALRLIQLPSPIPEAIVVGILVALIIWLLEKFGL